MLTLLFNYRIFSQWIIFNVRSNSNNIYTKAHYYYYTAMHFEESSRRNCWSFIRDRSKIVMVDWLVLLVFGICILVLLSVDEKEDCIKIFIHGASRQASNQAKRIHKACVKKNIYFFLRIENWNWRNFFCFVLLFFQSSNAIRLRIRIL